MNDLNHFQKQFESAVAKQKAKPSVQSKQVQQVVDANAITKPANTDIRMTEEEYKTSLIANAIAHLKHKQAGAM